MKLYFCSVDGNYRAVFKHEKNSKMWKEDQNTNLAWVHEVVYENKRIIQVDGQAFDEFIESVSDEVGTEEFNRVKTAMEKNFEYTDSIDD